jgi:parallel beta-helix repeat protein
MITVTNLNDAGSGSLRAAIGEANLNISGTPSVISFSVNGTIALASDLPPISHAIEIDATSAPSYSSGGAPVVELDCNSHAGLTFATGSAGSRLLGLAIGHADGNGVTLDAGSITLDKNYIGLNLAGAIFSNSGDGVFVSASSSNNLIGLNPTEASGVVSNVISGNTGNGISFHGSSGSTLVANRIGTDPTGTVAIPNGGNGIWLTASSNENEIGGTAFVDTSTGAVNDPTGGKGTVSPVFVVPPLGNLISGNSQNGILIDTDSQQNVLNGNFVGTTADGNGAIGNTLDGVAISGANNNLLIGCQFVNNPFVYYNVVSGNGENGLHITDSDNTTVQANFFGVGADNTAIIGNQANGILVDGTSANTQVGGVIPLGNVAAGNGQNGIEVRDTASGFITFNTFGGLLAFKGAAPNGNDGLLITSTGGNNTAQTNVFSGNLHDGIQISGDASGVTVDPNIAGLNTDGNIILPNGNDGIEIDGTAHDNVIGGSQSSVIPQNTFSGNAGYGVALLDQAYNNQVLLSYVGLSAGGTAGLGNLLGGILIGDAAHDNVIGGTSTQSATTTNLISANAENGVTLETGTSNIQVIDNAFGFDRFGIPNLPGSGYAIVVNGSVNAEISGNAIVAAFDTTTNQPVGVVGEAYAGPVADLQLEYINLTPDNLSVATSTPNWFIHSGGGDDAIAVDSGTNVLDGGTGSNFLTGGTGPDTFFVNNRGASADTWNTAVNFHAGDALTIWGVTPQDFLFDFEDDQGAPGFTGLTLHMTTTPSEPTASLTFVGFTAADLSNGRISESFGTDPVSGRTYTDFRANA